MVLVAQDRAALWLGGAVAAAGIGWFVTQALDGAAEEASQEGEEEEGSGQPTVVTGGGFGTAAGGSQGGLSPWLSRHGFMEAEGGAEADTGGADGGPRAGAGGGIRLSRETERQLVENQEAAQREALAEQRKTQKAKREAAQAQEDSATTQNIVASGIGAGAAFGTPAGLGTGVGLAATEALDESGAFDRVEESGRSFSEAVGPTASKAVKTAATPLSVPGAVATGLVGRGNVAENVGRAVSGTFIGDAGKAIGGLF